jgi:flagellar protein FlaG
VQNRFSSVVSNLAATSENLTASRSRILDADFAAETASLSRNQILQQAGTAMLAQANSCRRASSRCCAAKRTGLNSSNIGGAVAATRSTLPIPFLKEGKMNIQPTGHGRFSAAPAATRRVQQRRPVRSRQPAKRRSRRSRARPSLQAGRTPRPREKLEAATKSVRDFVEPINSNLEFSVDDDTGQMVVKIIDRATKEVIRQMPSEEMLAVAKALDSIKGLFIKQTA